MGSGPNIPESQRNTVQIKLRLSPETAAQLAQLSAGGERSEYVSRLIELAAKRAERAGKAAR